MTKEEFEEEVRERRIKLLNHEFKNGIKRNYPSRTSSGI